MTVKIPGHSTLTGQPETILRLLVEAQFTPQLIHDAQAESLLRKMAEDGIIIIEE